MDQIDEDLFGEDLEDIDLNLFDTFSSTIIDDHHHHHHDHHHPELDYDVELDLASEATFHGHSSQNTDCSQSTSEGPEPSEQWDRGATLSPRSDRHQPQTPDKPPVFKFKRRTANARERIRMREINKAFERLKKLVPVELMQQADEASGGPGPKSESRPPKGDSVKLTKITTLRLAVSYIAKLTEILKNQEKHNPSDLIIPSPAAGARDRTRASQGLKSSSTSKRRRRRQEAAACKRAPLKQETDKQQAAPGAPTSPAHQEQTKIVCQQEATPDLDQLPVKPQCGPIVAANAGLAANRLAAAPYFAAPGDRRFATPVAIVFLAIPSQPALAQGQSPSQQPSYQQTCQRTYRFHNYHGTSA